MGWKCKFKQRLLLFFKKEMKTHIHTEHCTWIFTTALVFNGQNPGKTSCLKQHMVNTQIKRHKLLSLWATWVHCKGFMSEKSQSPGVTQCDSIYMRFSKWQRDKTGVAKSWGGGVTTMDQHRDLFVLREQFCICWWFLKSALPLKCPGTRYTTTSACRNPWHPNRAHHLPNGVATGQFPDFDNVWGYGDL